MINAIGSKIIKNNFFGCSQRYQKITAFILSLGLGIIAFSCMYVGSDNFSWKVFGGGAGVIELVTLLFFKFNKNEQAAIPAVPRLPRRVITITHDPQASGGITSHSPGPTVTSRSPQVSVGTAPTVSGMLVTDAQRERNTRLQEHWLGERPSTGSDQIYRRIALEIMDDVAKLGIKSYNHCATFIAREGEDPREILQRKGSAIETHRAHMARIRDKLIQGQSLHDEGVPQDLVEAFRKNRNEGGDGSAALIGITAFFIDRRREGNCGELATLALKFGTYRYPGIPMKTIIITRRDNPNHDHVFLLIGEGPEAVICDPWSKPPTGAGLHERGVCYLARHCKHYLSNYLGIDASGRPQLARYSPRTDSWAIDLDYNPRRSMAHRMRIVTASEDKPSEGAYFD